MIVRKLLAAPGIHFIATRFAPLAVRKAAFDEKYRQKQWGSAPDRSSDLRSVIRHYLHRGSLLLLGCGASSILEGLETDGLDCAIGVDISEEALSLARRFESSKIKFVQQDMRTFSTCNLFDVILFSESLYYIPSPRAIELFKGDEKKSQSEWSIYCDAGGTRALLGVA